MNHQNMLLQIVNNKKSTEIMVKNARYLLRKHFGVTAPKSNQMNPAQPVVTLAEESYNKARKAVK